MFLLTDINLRIKYLLLITTLITFTSHAANSEHYLRQLQNHAKQQQLWKQTEWLNLLHYKDNDDSPDDYENSIRDTAFFLADNGNNNAESELIATLDSIYDNEKKDDENAQCRFVARLNWLKQKLAINTDTLPAVHCKEYIAWRENVQPQQVTLVFPTYHLNSPSSMFGHTLLRLDPEKDEDESKWLSVSISFGANVPEGENSALYAWRGLFGGYSGLFITDHYYKKIQEYNGIEHRDIWEYHLNLTSEEIERLVTHIWELQSINFDYYFFDENCSYRLLELLEIARPGIELTDEYMVTAIPIDTVKTINKAGMIENTEYRPSRATVLSYMLENMPENNRDLAIKLSDDIETKSNQNFTRLSLDEQREIIEAAYKYLRYQQSEKGRDPDIAKRSFQLLKLRNNYPVSEVPEVPAPVSPEKGHSSKRSSFALGKRLDNYYGEFGFKMSFHDLEDNEKGFLRGAQINIGSLQIRTEENESVSLYKLDLIDIFSLAPRTQFFKPVAWRIYTGFERQFTKVVDQLAYHVTGGGGGNWKFLGDNQFYTLATGRLEINRQMDHTVEPGIGFITGLLSHFGTNTARLEVSGEQFTGNTYRLRAQYIHNFVINTNNSLKIFGKYEWQENNVEFSDINLSYQYYF
jgi:hypothetical protein